MQDLWAGVKSVVPHALHEGELDHSGEKHISFVLALAKPYDDKHLSSSNGLTQYCSGAFRAHAHTSQPSMDSCRGRKFGYLFPNGYYPIFACSLSCTFAFCARRLLIQYSIFRTHPTIAFVLGVCIGLGTHANAAWSGRSNVWLARTKTNICIYIYIFHSMVYSTIQYMLLRNIYQVRISYTRVYIIKALYTLTKQNFS